MSFKISIESNLSELNTAIQQYSILSRKTVEEALSKQAVKLGFMLRKELREIAPPKDSIRQQLLDRLRRGLGVRVSELVLRRVYQSKGAQSLLSTGKTVFGKGKNKVATTRRGLNLWAVAVQAEISRRESARGFLSVASTYRGLSATTSEAEAVSRYGPVLSTAGLKVSPNGASFEFHWGEPSELSSSAAEGLSKTKGDAAVNKALANTLEDIETYIDRKLSEGWKR